MDNEETYMKEEYPGCYSDHEENTGNYVGEEKGEFDEEPVVAE